MKELVLHVPVAVQSEMTACAAMLGLSGVSAKGFCEGSTFSFF